MRYLGMWARDQELLPPQGMCLWSTVTVTSSRSLSSTACRHRCAHTRRDTPACHSQRIATTWNSDSAKKLTRKREGERDWGLARVRGGGEQTLRSWGVKRCALRCTVSSRPAWTSTPFPSSPHSAAHRTSLLFPLSCRTACQPRISFPVAPDPLFLFAFDGFLSAHLRADVRHVRLVHIALVLADLRPRFPAQRSTTRTNHHGAATKAHAHTPSAEPQFSHHVFLQINTTHRDKPRQKASSERGWGTCRGRTRGVLGQTSGGGEACRGR